MIAEINSSKTGYVNQFFEKQDKIQTFKPVLFCTEYNDECFSEQRNMRPRLIPSFSDVYKKKINSEEFLSQIYPNKIHWYADQTIAVKEFRRENDEWEDALIFQKEVNCNLILHPNLVNYIGYYLGSANKSSGILMEYIRLDLRRALMVDERFKELSVKLLIAKQVASGMNFLHSLTPYILHRDLRTPNILVTNDLECKITDFDLSINTCYSSELHRIYTPFIPPECWKTINLGNQKIEKKELDLTKFNKKGDVYFYGWVLVELFLNKEHQDSLSKNTIYQLLLTKRTDAWIISLIFSCFNREPNERSSFKEVCDVFHYLDKKENNVINIEAIAQTKDKFSLHQFFSANDIIALLDTKDCLGRTLVHQFCIFNNEVGLKELSAHVNKITFISLLNQTDKDDYTCAHFACRNGSYNIIQFLKMNNFQLWNKKERRFGTTPLTLLIAMNHVHCIDSFIVSQCDTNNFHESLLACSQVGNVKTISLLMSLKSLVNINLNYTDNHRYYKSTPKTALAWACMYGHYDVVSHLIECGVDVDFAMSDGKTALFYACGYTPIVQMLFHNQAVCRSHKKDIRKGSPLHISIENGYFGTVKFLLANDHHKIDSTLSLAWQNKRYEIVNYLLESKDIDVNLGDKQGKTPLFYACQNGDLKNILRLIRMGANVNTRDVRGRTVLFVACSIRRPFNVIKLLIDNGIDVNMATEVENATAMFVLCRFDEVESIELLIKNGANINHVDNQGQTVLFNACEYSNLDVVKLLIEKGIDIHHTDYDGFNVFNVLFGYFTTYKKRNDFVEIVKLLLDRGVQRGDYLSLVYQYKELEVLKLMTDHEIVKNNKNLLPCACYNNDALRIFTYMFEKGANIHWAGYNETTLQLACINGNAQLVGFLLDHGAAINGCKAYLEVLLQTVTHEYIDVVKLLLKYWLKQIPLHFIDRLTYAIGIAYEKRNMKLFEILINHFKSELPPNYWSKFLYNESRTGDGNIEGLKFILEQGANINMYDGQKQTPLFIACEHSQIDTCWLLLENGADINMIDCNGNTIINHAVQESCFDIVHLLIKHWKLNTNSINIPDKNGDTPLIKTCKRKNSLKFVKLLVNMGADVNHANKHGITPLINACYNNFDLNVLFLLQNECNITFTSSDLETHYHCTCEYCDMNHIKGDLYLYLNKDIICRRCFLYRFKRVLFSETTIEKITTPKWYQNFKKITGRNQHSGA